MLICLPSGSTLSNNPVATVLRLNSAASTTWDDFLKDLRSGFIPNFENLSRFDMMNPFVTNTGAASGGNVERALLEG